MFMKQPRPRGFEYFPYYLTESNEEEESEHRIKFQRLTKSPQVKRRPVALLIILAAAVFVLWQYFGELAEKDPKSKRVVGV